MGQEVSVSIDSWEREKLRVYEQERREQKEANDRLASDLNDCLSECEDIPRIMMFSKAQRERCKQARGRFFQTFLTAAGDEPRESSMNRLLDDILRR